MKKFIFQFSPNNFPWLFENKKIKYKDHELKTSYLIDLMHTFIVRKYLYKINEINLWSVILRKRYGTFYNHYVDWLIDHKVIVLKSKWQAGNKSKTYSLKLDLNKEKIIRYKNNDKVLLKKIHHRENKELSSIHKLLIADLHFVNLDYDKAKQSLENEFNVGLIDEKKYFRNMLSLDAIKHNTLFWGCDDYGRMHTNFTNLKKSLRNNFLTLSGNRICELDIKNSQPVFLAKMMQDSGEELGPELKRFVQCVKAGLFYDSFKSLDLSKKQTKELVYQVFFGKNQSNTINDNFKTIWPDLWNWIVEWKKKKGHHRALAHTLQRLESDLVYNHICTEIKKALPDSPMFTVHDSIFFQEKDLSIIEPIFNHYVSNILNN